MWPSLRDSAIMTSFVLCVALAAAAQTGGRDLDGADGFLRAETMGGLARFQAKWTSVGRARAISDSREGGAPPLDDEQRSRIRESVVTSADAVVTPAPAPELAETLPSGVPLLQ